mmetsp:Transcript_22030/g.3657  ORF Transcript_22030/g.3657 Transcript_22030/m.3657 type:complete len:106 (+) Transcript_22030:371-688(+)
MYNESTTRFIIGCIVLGIQYLHQQEIIHRDIKPENILIDNQGFLCISDLGIARRSNGNHCKEISGTLQYMAPEVINRKNHGKAVDFYALGVIAYECLLGKRPYPG